MREYSHFCRPIQHDALLSGSLFAIFCGGIREDDLWQV